jgi:hypothetical protein
VPDWVAEQIERSLGDAARVDGYRGAAGGVVVARGVAARGRRLARANHNRRR